MKEIEDMSLNELVDFFTGRACIAIGQGQFRSEICTIITCSMRLGAENEREIMKPKRKHKRSVKA